MRIALYTPFKPLIHPRLSGDVTLFKDLLDFFQAQGHEAEVMSHYSTQWLYNKPWKWPEALSARAGMIKAVERFQPDCWLTYHSYFKSPDVFGPWAAKEGIPYFMLSGAYASKRRRRLKTRLGYVLNKRALGAAQALFTNKTSDYERLCSVFGQERVHYMHPGIESASFPPCPEAGRAQRKRLGFRADDTVAVCVAMLRPGTKSLGVEWVITTLAVLDPSIRPKLLIAGDGPEKERLQKLAEEHMPGSVRFLGLVRRRKLPEVYSAGDFFVFPGINEGLGLVYLEAQSCGLPAVAWDHGGAKEVIGHNESGFITPSYDQDSFARAMERLCTDKDLRERMSRAAMRFVRERHELHRNYKAMEQRMQDLVDQRQGAFA